MIPKAFLDNDIVLDLLSARMPFYLDVAKLFTASRQGKCQLFVSSLTFSNAFYIIRRQHDMNIAWQKMRQLKTLVHILAVDESVVEGALASDFKDFEDALQYFTCIKNKIPNFLTRNFQDYKSASIPIIHVSDFLNSI
jgi:predicted nucleic acid-binding protein